MTWFILALAAVIVAPLLISRNPLDDKFYDD